MLDIPAVQALLAEQKINDAKLIAIADKYEELKETAISLGIGTTGAEWALLVRAFEANTGRKALRTEDIRLRTEIKALTGDVRLPKLAVWLLLVKLQEVSDHLGPEDAAYGAFHDLFDWAEDIYSGQVEHSALWDELIPPGVLN